MPFNSIASNFMYNKIQTRWRFKSALRINSCLTITYYKCRQMHHPCALQCHHKIASQFQSQIRLIDALNQH